MMHDIITFLTNRHNFLMTEKMTDCGKLAGQVFWCDAGKCKNHWVTISNKHTRCYVMVKCLNKELKIAKTSINWNKNKKDQKDYVDEETEEKKKLLARLDKQEKEIELLRKAVERLSLLVDANGNLGGLT